VTNQPEQSETGPNAGHDPAALHEAERRMTLRDDDTPQGEGEERPAEQVGGEHDPEALKEAEERMTLRDDRT
jgi:hypothetical protein